MRNNQLDQGSQSSLIDLFIRKCLLSLAILNFNDLIKLSERFNRFRTNQIESHDGQEKDKIKQLQTRIGNMNINTNCLIHVDTMKDRNLINNNKYLVESQLYALENKKHNKMAQKLHEFFDKQISNLTNPSQNQPSGQQSQNNINRIHHAPINLAFLNLQMGYLDESLSGISEGLR